MTEAAQLTKQTCTYALKQRAITSVTSECLVRITQSFQQFLQTLLTSAMFLLNSR